MIPAMDKLRTMTFGDVEKKTGSAGPDAAGPARPGATATHPRPPPHYFRHGPALVVRPPGGAGSRSTTWRASSRWSCPGRRTARSRSCPSTARTSWRWAPGPEDHPDRRRRQRDRLAHPGPPPAGRRRRDADRRAGGRRLQRGPIRLRVRGRGHRWDVAELPEGLRASPVVGPKTATIEGGGHIYTFAARTGKWEHVDVKAILDIAGAERK